MSNLEIILIILIATLFFFVLFVVMYLISENQMSKKLKHLVHDLQCDFYNSLEKLEKRIEELEKQKRGKRK